ncbi:MAG: alpha-L-fucosidase [Eubacteriales bacterium]|nr:alpha-L-fucosidase [Eubacteriales bacterium]
MKEMNWFSDAHYGLFIHWGLYSLMGGVHEGKEIPYGAEWIQKNAGIPLHEYRKLAARFNPVKFDAAEVVRRAKKWGMKYIVFTAKHVDGFAMYDSKVSSYNIMHTPYRQDPLRALADECEKQGLMLGIYYSQNQDWEDPNGWGNELDFPPNSEKDFAKYFHEKALPQVKELLTNYGKVGLMWFDTPYSMPKELCEELRAAVNALQPNCLINGRIGYNLGDYREMADNEIPVLPYEKPWETPMTLNQTWGYSSVDEHWKSPAEVIERLVEVVEKGGNLLLNVGPDGLGNIPEGSCAVLDEVGAWLEKNGESIYGTAGVPAFPYQNRWGHITRKGTRLYLHVFRYPDFPYEILLCNLRQKVRKVTLLETGEALTFYQSYEIGRNEYRFRVILPEKPERPSWDTVVCAECESAELSFEPLA